MNDPTKTIGLLTLMLVGAGCAATAPTRASLGQLQARATYDLACPSPWMRVYHLDESTKGVVGCGRRATYVERCEAVADGHCTWALDMQIEVAVAQSTPLVQRAPLPETADPLGDRH